MYSRRATVEAKKNKQKALMLFIICILFVGGFVYWGIPLTVQYLGFLTDLRKTDQSLDRNDTIPPPIPRFAPLPESTNQSEVELTGVSEPGSTISFFVNGEKTEVLANTNGEAKHSIALNDGDNIIYAQARDSSKNESDNSERIVIVYDTTTPIIQIESPANEATFYGQKERQISVTGKTEPQARLTISGRLVIPDSEGTFKTQISLANGENQILVKAEDLAGNYQEQQIKVHYYQ